MMSNTDEPKPTWNTFIFGFMVASCIGLVLAFAWNETETHKLEQAWLDNCLYDFGGLKGVACLDLAVMIDNKNPNFFPENTSIGSSILPTYIQGFEDSIQE
jgi:hypothetical protein